MNGEAPFVYLNPVRFLFLKGSAAPRLCRPFNFKKSPPRKKSEWRERQGERAGRAVLRAWRGSEGRHAIGAQDVGQSHHARGACEVRGSAGSGFAQRLELLHKSKLPRQRGQMRRAPAARGGVRVRISCGECGRNPRAGTGCRNKIVIVLKESKSYLYVQTKIFSLRAQIDRR